MRSTELRPPSASARSLPAVIEGVDFYRLFHQAERVRWRIDDIHWNAIDKRVVDDKLIGMVASIAGSEITTWSASRMFLESFSSDVDFTQWISIWLYEETKHPHVLMQWLRCVGHSFDESFIASHREAEAFIRSKVGTLAMNILSEIEAASIYMGLSNECPEPVLRRITSLLAGDEARHAASFYTYARKMLDSSLEPKRERHEILRILFLWLNSFSDLKHPVAMIAHTLFGERMANPESRGDQFRRRVEKRMLGVIGALLDLDLIDRDDLIMAIRS